MSDFWIYMISIAMVVGGTFSAYYLGKKRGLLEGFVEGCKKGFMDGAKVMEEINDTIGLDKMKHIKPIDINEHPELKNIIDKIIEEDENVEEKNNNNEQQ